MARTGGLTELVHGTRAALTFEPGNPYDLAHCIELVLTDPHVREELVTNARDLIETEYSWASIATATLASYRCADLGRRGRSPGDPV